MKKLTVIVTGIAIVLGNTALADRSENNPDIFGSFGRDKAFDVSAVTLTKEISKSFSSKFSGAENVSWRQREEFYFADFKVNQKNMFAAYTPEGELLGVTRVLELSQLPFNVEMSIRENFVNHRIDKTITEMVHDGETTYHLNAESKTHFLKLKCNSEGEVYVVKRTKKKLIGSVY